MAPLAHREFARILIIKPTAMGDVVHAVPTLVALRRRFPQARIDWLVTPENAELVRHHPALDGVVLFDRRAYRRGWRGLAKLPGFLKELRQGQYDLVVDLHGQLRSAAFGLATGAPVRIGFARPARQGGLRRGWAGAREGAWLAYTHQIPIPTLEVHAVDRYLWVGGLLGFEPGEPEQRLYLAPEAGGQVDVSGRLAVLAPFTMWETKHWRLEGFAEVAQALAGEGWRVVIVGGASDQVLGEQLREACPAARNLCGKTSTGELAALIGRAGLCVSNDSGTAHLAVAMGTPLVAIYGPTNPVMVGPYRQPESVVRLGLPCSPCNFRRLEQCPHGHACMQQLPASAVLARVRAVLGAG